MNKRHYRIIIEVFCLLLLCGGAWLERSTLVDSFRTIQNSDATFVLSCFALLWLNFLWSGMSYKLLAPNIPLKDICLAHLAASGPGRVIPGGAGHLSFGVLFLRRQKYSMEQSVAIATANNIIGFSVNLLLLIGIAILRPHDLARTSFPYRYIAFVMLAILVLVFALVTFHGTKNTITSYFSVFKKTIRSRLRKPKVTIGLVATMLATITTNTTCLFLACHATGLSATIYQALIVMSAGVAVGSLLPTPGGVGGVEAGIIASLRLLGFDAVSATAAALVYRSATYLQPLLPGCVAYVYLRNKKML